MRVTNTENKNPLTKQYFSEKSLPNIPNKPNSKAKENTFITTEKTLYTESTQSEIDNNKKVNKNYINSLLNDDAKTKSFNNLSESLLYDPKLKRRDAKETYEKPVSERESWWRVSIKETPLPSAYEIADNYTFINDIKRKPNTYSFKSDGRRLDPMPHIGKGDYLMPGKYEFDDFTDRLNKSKVTYGFKGPERESLLEKSILGYHDKDVNVSPDTYNTEKYHQINAEVEQISHPSFKSKTKRKLFPPKEGPPPGCYESPSFTDKPRAISSCFKSKTSRFPKSQTLAPGPGAYWPLTQWPISKNIEKLGEKGVFFTTNFKEVSY